MLNKFIPIAVRAEPVFAASFVQSALALGIALGLHFTVGQTAAIESTAAAFLAVISALSVDKATPALYTGLLTAGGTCLTAFCVPHVTSGSVSAVSGMMAIIMGSLLREKVTPVSKLTKAPLTAAPAAAAPAPAPVAAPAPVLAQAVAAPAPPGI